MLGGLAGDRNSCAIVSSFVEMEARRGKYRAGQCAICGGGLVGDCARCGVELCGDHLHGDDDRCALCEREYEARYSVRDGGLYVATMLACPSLLCLAVLGTMSIGTIGPVIAGTILVTTLLGVAKGFPWARKRLAEGMRQRFLAEHPVPAAKVLRA